MCSLRCFNAVLMPDEHFSSTGTCRASCVQWDMASAGLVRLCHPVSKGDGMMLQLSQKQTQGMLFSFPSVQVTHPVSWEVSYLLQIHFQSLQWE